MFIWNEKKKTYRMDHVEIGELLFTVMERSGFFSTAASHRGHRPKEEVLVIEDDII